MKLYQTIDSIPDALLHDPNKKIFKLPEGWAMLTKEELSSFIKSLI